jgi:hypothetical protein
MLESDTGYRCAGIAGAVIPDKGAAIKGPDTRKIVSGPFIFINDHI